MKRLYVVTGKGGVGKTTVALALTKYLHDQGRKVLYNSFDAEPPREKLEALKLPWIHYTVDESAETYVGIKLKSPMIAGWVMKTPFFHSLFHMLPGLGHMILMGHLIKLMEDDPELTIIIDSPASGHAMSMFESTHNFKEMFGEGLIVNDIDRMHAFLYGPGNMEILVTTLPTLMAVQEGIELKDHLVSLGYENCKILMNASLKTFLSDAGLQKSDFPEALQRKVEVEEECLENYASEVSHSFPYFPTGEMVQVDKVAHKLGEMLK